MNNAELFTGNVAPVSAAHIADVASALQVETAALKAVLEVECRGSGFYRSGRLTMLYEPHIVYRYSSGDVRVKLVRMGLASLSAGAIPYPPTEAERYAQFNQCALVGDIELACKSCSWGLPQGMGFNHKPFGYASAEEMVRAFAQKGEAEQIEAMGRFIAANPAMHRALRNTMWATFAKAYNGTGYAKNRYDTKLATAYLKFKALEAKDGNMHFTRVLREGSKGNDVLAMQRLLTGAGFPVDIDGHFGRITKQELMRFQRKSKLTADGVAGPITLEALMGANKGK